MSEKEIKRIYGEDYIAPDEDYEEMLIDDERKWQALHNVTSINQKRISIRKILGVEE